MSATVTRLAVALCAAITIACGGGGGTETEYDAQAQSAIERGEARGTSGMEATGTSGTSEQLVTMSGCVVQADDGRFLLTSPDEAILREETGTPASGDAERQRHALNPSAELGRYRLDGDAERLGMLVDREVEVQGRLQAADAVNRTPAALEIETIDATGPRCAAR